MRAPRRSIDARPFDPAELGRVFTVQLRDPSPGDPALAGRLTHAATGRAAHFDSADELVSLLTEESSRLRREASRS